jgi:acyl-CoA synthetase (AMP-forming)/AMP-acid ligase II
MINFDGIKVYPADLEAALQGHPAVVEAAAFPVTVQGYRQVPAAAVILRAAATSEELIAFCRPLLGPRSPRAIYVLDGFPRNAIGKVLKRELAERFSPGRNDGPAGAPPQPR